MYEPKTPEQYMQLLDQALFDMEDLLRCAEDEGEAELDFTKQIANYEQILAGMRRLRDDLVSGNHEFGHGKDLPFIETVRKASRIPFRPLLDTLNSVYRRGFPGE